MVFGSDIAYVYYRQPYIFNSKVLTVLTNLMTHYQNLQDGMTLGAPSQMWSQLDGWLDKHHYGATHCKS